MRHKNNFPYIRAYVARSYRWFNFSSVRQMFKKLAKRSMWDFWDPYDNPSDECDNHVLM